MIHCVTGVTSQYHSLRGFECYGLVLEPADVISGRMKLTFVGADFKRKRPSVESFLSKCEAVLAHK
jgi:hypothetical protein